MVKILLCCGGGFSSSYISTHMKKDIIDKCLKDKVSIDFSPFSIALEKKDDYDILVCCPHLRINVDLLVKEQDLDIPIYILPPRMYGNMSIEDIYYDAIDIIEIFENTRKNPVHFDGEEQILRVTRIKAYRNT